MWLWNLFLGVAAGLLYFAACTDGSAAAVGDGDAEPPRQLDGQYLLELGRNYDKPLLRLLGRALRRSEEQQKSLQANITESMQSQQAELADRLCSIDPCSEWSPWTDCPALFKGQFSLVTRTRECGQNTTLCTYPEGTDYATHESKVCEGSNSSLLCPPPYTLVSQFCVRLYKDKMGQPRAQARCRADGGHLANVNTQAKIDALHGYIKDNGGSGDSVWIDGTKVEGGSWEYTHGPAPDVEDWRTGQPNNSGSPVCKDVYQGHWDDDSCTSMYLSLCEILF